MVADGAERITGFARLTSVAEPAPGPPHPAAEPAALTCRPIKAVRRHVEFTATPAATPERSPSASTPFFSRRFSNSRPKTWLNRSAERLITVTRSASRSSILISLSSFQGNQNATLLVHATSRTIHVFEDDFHAVDPPVELVDGEIDTPLEQLVRGLIQIDATG